MTYKQNRGFQDRSLKPLGHPSGSAACQYHQGAAGGKRGSWDRAQQFVQLRRQILRVVDGQVAQAVLADIGGGALGEERAAGEEGPIRLVARRVGRDDGDDDAGEGAGVDFMQERFGVRARRVAGNDDLARVARGVVESGKESGGVGGIVAQIAGKTRRDRPGLFLEGSARTKERQTVECFQSGGIGRGRAIFVEIDPRGDLVRVCSGYRPEWRARLGLKLLQCRRHQSACRIEPRDIEIRFEQVEEGEGEEGVIGKKAGLGFPALAPAVREALDLGIGR